MMKTIDEVTIVADGLDHPECVAIHPIDGSVWAGGEGGQLYRISGDGKTVEEVANTGGFTLGIAFSPDNSWIAMCDLKKKCVWKYDITSGKTELFATGTKDRNFITPNYPIFDKEGNLYVSDSGNFRKVNGCIYKFNTLGDGEVWHEGPFSFTNGLALSGDQKKLFVVCTWLPGVEAIDILSDGSAGARNVVVTLPQTCPDGIAVSNSGELYISCYAPNAIFRIDDNGEVHTLISDWESHTICNPTNIAFNPHNPNELFIANLGRWHIAKLTL